jgi:lipopolysaccharide export LptBFGC system permease protein LptF
LIGIGYYLVEHFVGPLSMVYQIPACLAAFIPIASVMVLSLVLWRYIR